MRHGTSSTARVLLACALAGALAPLAATASFAGVRQVGPVKVEGTRDNKFVPKDIKATPDADGNVTIEFTSKGFHTIQSDEVKGFDSGPVQDTTKTITFAAEPGTYQVYCLYHKTAGMTGTLVVAGEATETPAATEEPSSAPPESETASPTAAATEEPTAAAEDDGEDAVSEDDPSHDVPGVADNPTLKRINAEREAEAGAVSGFKFFTFVSIAFLFILGAAVLFSTRPRRTSR